jgi:hypothetical protein
LKSFAKLTTTTLQVTKPPTGLLKRLTQTAIVYELFAESDHVASLRKYHAGTDDAWCEDGTWQFRWIRREGIIRASRLEVYGSGVYSYALFEKDRRRRSGLLTITYEEYYYYGPTSEENSVTQFSTRDLEPLVYFHPGTSENTVLTVEIVPSAMPLHILPLVTLLGVYLRLTLHEQEFHFWELLGLVPTFHGT